MEAAQDRRLQRAAPFRNICQHEQTLAAIDLLNSNALEAQSGPPPAPILRVLKRESGSEVDLQEVILRSVDDIPSGFGKHSDVRREAIFESATKVA